MSRPVLALMREDHIPAGHALSIKAGWPHRREDWAFLLRLGHGFVLEAGGQIIGTIMVWPVSEAMSALGLVIVSEDHRGHGHARSLMDAALDSVSSPSITLNATEIAVPLYRQYGFATIGAISQHQGQVAVGEFPAPSSGTQIRPLQMTDLDAIARFDCLATGYRRDDLLRATMHKWGGVAALTDGSLVGYCLYRRFGLGYVAGPLIANDEAIAKDLILWAVHRARDQFLRLDIPTDPNLSAWLETLGLTCIGSADCMALGTRPAPVTSGRVFCVSGHAIG